MLVKNLNTPVTLMSSSYYSVCFPFRMETFAVLTTVPVPPDHLTCGTKDHLVDHLNGVYVGPKEQNFYWTRELSHAGWQLGLEL